MQQVTNQADEKNWQAQETEKEPKEEE